MWKNTAGAGDGEALSTLLTNGDVAPKSIWQGESDCRWYAAYTVSCHEKQVSEHLKARGIEHYLPLYTSIRRWASGRIVTRECPLFPSYVFVQMCREERGRVLSVPGILSMVGTSKGATPLPTSEIETLRSGLHRYNATPHPFLGIGERVRILSGPLAGMQGIVLRHHGGTRIVLSLDLIMKSIAVEVDEADLEPITPRISNPS
jgi:transcription antitermination factor NusG